MMLATAYRTFCKYLIKYVLQCTLPRLQEYGNAARDSRQPRGPEICRDWICLEWQAADPCPPGISSRRDFPFLDPIPVSMKSCTRMIFSVASSAFVAKLHAAARSARRTPCHVAGGGRPGATLPPTLRRSVTRTRPSIDRGVSSSSELSATVARVHSLGGLAPPDGHSEGESGRV